MPRSLGLLLVLCVGVLLAVQPAVNSQLSRHTGSLGAAFVSLVGSALAIGLILVASGNAGRLAGVGDVSPVYVTGGLMGAFNVTIALFAISRIGAGGVVAVSITSQLIVAAILDHFGLLGLDRTELTAPTVVGFLLLVAGVVLVTVR
jgi:bacterial/archaeal transporter family-2 protein